MHCYKQYGLKGWLYIILKDIYTLLNIILNSKGRKKDKMKVVLNGFIEGLVFQPEIEMCNDGIGESRGYTKIRNTTAYYSDYCTSVCEVAA